MQNSDNDRISKIKATKKDSISNRIFFTSDLHLGHKRILEYTNRPFENIDTMNTAIVDNWNKKVTANDLVYHVGDFSFGNSAREWEQKLHGDIVHIEGNHDKNNGVKTYIVKCIMHFGGKSIFVQHRPPSSQFEIPIGVDFCICGHVHQLWRHKWVGGIPVINVGVDVWGFEPISVDSVLKYYDKIMRDKNESRS